MWSVKATVMIIVVCVWALIPKLSGLFHYIPGTTPEISVQKSATPETAKILLRTLKLPGLWWGNQARRRRYVYTVFLSCTWTLAAYQE